MQDERNALISLLRGETKSFVTRSGEMASAVVLLLMLFDYNVNCQCCRDSDYEHPEYKVFIEE